MSQEHRKRILMLAPSEETICRFGELLNRESFDLVTVSSGRTALSSASAQSWDLLVAVLPIPDISVGRLVCALRELPRPSSSIPLILVGRGPQLGVVRAFQGPLVRVVDRAERGDEMQRAFAESLGLATRWSVRLPLEVDVEVDSGSIHQTCTTRNFSSSGMLVRSDSAPPLGSLFDFELILPRIAEPLSGRAQVVRFSDPVREHTTGFAARFVGLSSVESSRLDNYVHTALRAH